MVMKRKQKPRNPRPKIDYPPVETKTWIPPDQRPKKKKKSPYKKPSKLTVKLPISRLKRIWHNFEFVDKDEMLLVGHYSQFYKKYSFVTNGYQAPCNCVVACAFAQMFDMAKWTSFTLDKALDIGDKLYQESARMQLEKSKKDLKYSDVYHTFFIGNYRVTMDMKGKQVAGKFNLDSEEAINFLAVAKAFLKDNGFAVLLVDQKRYFAVWCIGKGYFVFDPCEHDSKGNNWMEPVGRGFCILVRVRKPEVMRQIILESVKSTEVNPGFVMTACQVVRRFQINTDYPACLDDANLELYALSDADKKKMEERQLERMKEKGAAPPPKPKDPNEVMVEVDEDERDLDVDQKPKDEKPKEQAEAPAEDEEGKEKEAKFTLVKVKPPLEKVKPSSVTYFTELKPHEVGILRASMHLGDKRFRHFAGKQSIAMAISAVAMLRLYSSKYWTQTTLDEILRNGNWIYRDSMKIFPAEPFMKITTICKTFKINEKEYVPNIEIFNVVGRLGSDSGDILDLKPALKEFFSEHDAGIVLGPLTVAVWCEKGFYYMFDPNERDKNGQKMVKEVQIASELQVISVPDGAACLFWFSNLKELSETYIRNVDRELRRAPFVLCRIQIEDYVGLPPDYHDFKAVSATRWMVRGTFSQNNKRFDDSIRNTQCMAIAAFAIAMNELQHIKLWTTETMNKIVEFGSAYYEECISVLKTKNKFVSRLLMVDELNPTFKYESKEIIFDFQSCTVNGDINNDDTDRILNLKMGLTQFFSDIACCGILTCRGIACAVFNLESFYYYFDSHTKNEEGLPSFYGTSMVIRTSTVDELTNIVLANLSADTNNLYNISRVGVEIYDGVGIPRPPLNHFIGLDENRAILRSSWNERDDRFGIRAGKQTVCMNLMAIAMTYVLPTLTWNVDVINKVMDLGDELYVQCMEKLIGGKDKERVIEVPPPPAPPAVVLKEEPVSEDEKEKNKGRRRGGERTKRAVKEKEEPPPPPAPEPEPEKPVVEDVQQDAEEITVDNVEKTFTIGVNRFDIEKSDAQVGTYDDLEDTLKGIYVQEMSPDDGDKPKQSASNLKNPTTPPPPPPPPPPATEDEETGRKLYVIESKHMTCAMWREGGVFYIFDPQPRNESGQIYGKEEWPQKNPPRRQVFRRVSAGGTATDTDVGGGGDVTSETTATQEPRSERTEKSDLTNIVGGHEYKGGRGYFYEREPSLFGEEEEDFDILEKHSSHYWREKEKNGKGYVLRFVYPEDLVKHVVGNTPPLETDLPYKLTALRLFNTPVQKEVFNGDTDAKSDVKNVGDWNNFKEIDSGKWILRGTTTETCETFPSSNRGRQCVAIALLALSFQHLYSLPVFKTQTVDDILMYGDRLYTFSFNTQKKKRMEEKKERLSEANLDEAIATDLAKRENLAKEFCIGADMISLRMEDRKVEGEINAGQQEKMLDVKRGLEEFFATQKTGIIEAKDLQVAIWKKGQIYYMYDPHSRGPNGAKCPNGVACITRFADIQHLANLFLGNLTTDGDNRFYVHAVDVESMKCPRQEVRKKEPKLKPTKLVTGFLPVTPGKIIIHGGISQREQTFGRRVDAQSAPMALVALAMSLVHNPMFWTKPIIDEIVRIGDGLYGAALDTLGYAFNPWEETLTLDLAPKDFRIGELKASCELRSNEQTGVVDAKGPMSTLNLRQGLEAFFKENTHGVVVTEPLMVAIWEEDEPKKTLYMFDPCPRGASGMPPTREVPAGAAALSKGAACVLSFDSCKLAADHFAALLQSEAGVEFTVRPVEVCVGKMKTKGKDKRKEPVPLVVFGKAITRKKLTKPMEKKKLQQMVGFVKLHHYLVE